MEIQWQLATVPSPNCSFSQISTVNCLFYPS